MRLLDQDTLEARRAALRRQREALLRGEKPPPIEEAAARPTIQEETVDCGDASKFLRTLWAEEPLPGALVAWTRSVRGGRSESIWCKSLEEAAEAALRHRDQREVYFGVALQDPEKALASARKKGSSIELSGVRGGNASAVAIPGVWADIDIKAPVHSEQDLPPGQDAALSLLNALPHEPTVIVNSGFGLHVYWLFHEPWVFTSGEDRDRAAQLLRGVQAALRAEAEGHGWRLDPTADLARVLRLPETFNRKGEEVRPVRVESFEPDCRYDPGEIGDFLPEASPEEIAPPHREARKEGPPVDIEAVLAGCAWLQHTYEDRAELPEPEWYAALSIVGRCAQGALDGRELAHEWSEGYPGYSRQETDRKLDHALRASGPRTCAKIARELGGLGPYCSKCPHWGKIKSPIVLGGRGFQRVPVVIGADEKRVNDSALEALADHPDLFRRGNLLVHLVRDDGPRRGVSTPGRPRIVSLPAAVLREMLAERVEFRKPTKGGLKPASPPQWCVRALSARGNWPELRPLEGVTETPVLLPAGSVLQEPGYSPETGLYYLPASAHPPVPAQPTAAQKWDALALLRESVRDFPFASRSHFAAYLAAVLTILGRYAFRGPAPCFLVDSNTAGTGKGLLLSVAGWSATGRTVPRMPYSQNPEEQRKAILALALEGVRVALIDNVTGRFGSGILDAAFTASEWSDRLLGVSKTARVPLTIVWFATGNNVSVVGDTLRRCAYIRLESPEEHPDRRGGFLHEDLLAWAEANSPRLVAAGLTLLRAFAAAGFPDQRLPSWGSFEGWSKLIRECIVWLDLPDPAETRMDLHDSPAGERDALTGLVTGLEEVLADFDGQCGTASAILSALDREEDRYQRLREALAEVVPRPGAGELPTAHQLGAILKHQRGRVIARKVIEHARPGKTSGGILWCVRTPRKGGGSDGSDGSDIDSTRRRTPAPPHGDGNPTVSGENRLGSTSPTSPASQPGGEERWRI